MLRSVLSGAGRDGLVSLVATPRSVLHICVVVPRSFARAWGRQNALFFAEKVLVMFVPLRNDPPRI